MSSLLDIFNDDAFSVRELTIAVDKLPYAPGRLGKLNLFRNAPATSQMAIVEERHGKLSLLSAQPRGSQDQQAYGSARRKVRAFNIPHVPQWDAVLASDLEGKRAFGSTDQLEVFSEILNDRFTAMKNNHEVTHEYHRIGAIKGVVLDADGSTELVNWFTEFGISELEVEFNKYDAGTLDDADPAADWKTLSQTVIRHIRNGLGATPFKGVHALCGDNFFDALISHATVRRAYERWQDGQIFRESQIGEGNVFSFAGIDWENYRGSIGAVDFIDTDSCRFFPTGTSDIFLEIPAPADFVETVNSRGMMMYAKQERMKWDKGIELHTQSNVLYMCTRPTVLVKGTLTNEAPGSGS